MKIIAILVVVLGLMGIGYGFYTLKGYNRKMTSIVMGLSVLMMSSGLVLYIYGKNNTSTEYGDYVYTDSGGRKPLVPLEVEFDDDEEDTIVEYTGGGENDREIGGTGEVDIGMLTDKDGTVKVQAGEPIEVNGKDKVEKGKENKKEEKPKEEVNREEKPKEDKEPPKSGKEPPKEVPEEDKPKEDVEEPKEDVDIEKPKEDTEEPKEEPDEEPTEPEYSVGDKIEKYKGNYKGIASRLKGVESSELDYEVKKSNMRNIRNELSAVVGEIKAWKTIPQGKDKEVYDEFWGKISLSYIKVERAISEYQEDTDEMRKNYSRLISEAISIVN